MQERMNRSSKRWRVSLLALLSVLLLLSVMPITEYTRDVHAYTAAQRPGLQPSDIAVSRDRILRSAKAHVDRANQVGYGYNNVLSGTEYLPLATSTRKFCCVDLVTHVIYTATASKINGQYSSIANTLATRHAFANSNGIVFNTSGTIPLRRQLTAMPQLYTRHVAPVDKTQLRLGDIVISGYRDSMYNPTSPTANMHTTLVIGKVTPAENAYLQIPNYNANTSYFITMSSSRGAEWVSTNQYNREWNSGDPNKGYFISNMFRMKESPAYQDYGGFRIKKTDASTGAGLTGAEYDLKDSNGEVRLHIKMTSSEFTSSMDFVPGTYTLTETKAPDGYTLDPTPRTIEIEMDTINSVHWDTPITNAPSDGFVQVTKKDADTGESISGAVFDLSQSSTFPMGSTVRLTTRADGTTVPQRFGIGAGATVYVREVSVPAPYLCETTVKQVTLKASETVGVTFENRRAEGRLEIAKQGENNAPVQGAVFEVRNAADILVATLTTDVQGKAQTGLLPLGAYTVTETSVSAPYILDPTPLNVTLTYKDMNTPIIVEARTIRNEAAKGRLEITKQGENNTPVQGAVFQVRNVANTLVATLTTNAQGKANTGLLPLGTYTVTETSVPAPYILDPTPINVTLAYKDMNTPIVVEARTIRNDAAKGRIEITKRGQNNTPVQGAVFEVRNAADTLAATLTTDEKGKATTGLLPLGTYTVTETSVPAPYIFDPTPLTVTLAYKDTNTPIVVESKTIRNEAAKGQLEITKQGENNTPVQGAIFEVRNAANTLVATLTTDEQGKATSGHLPLGTYTLTESFVPAPYILDTTPINVTLSYKDVNTPIVVEAKTIGNVAAEGRIKINKKDAINQEVLAGAVFEIYDAGNAIVDTITTDASGVAISKNLPLGAYTVKEKTPPFGFVPNETVHNAVLTYEDMHTPVVETEMTIENEPIRGKIRMIKLAKGDATPIEGVSFELFNPDDTPAADLYGDPVGVLTTNRDGMALTPYLRAGTYIIRETGAPEAFRLNDEDFEAEIIRHGEVVNRYVRNERVLLRIRIIKSDSTTDEPLQGAVFQIYDAEGDLVTFNVLKDGRSAVVDRLITNDEGFAISAGALFAGTYTLKEIKAPDGYTSGEDVTFEIARDTKYVEFPFIGKMLDVPIGNAPTVIELSKKTITGDGELPGAHLCLIEKESGAIVEEWVSTDKPHIVRRLKVGSTYVLRETISPAGYTVATDIEFTVLDTGDVQPVVMRNELTCVEIHKKDKSTGSALEGVEFLIRDKDKNVQRFVCDTEMNAYIWEEGERADNSSVLTTNVDGAILIYGLPIGEYEFVEMKELPGYKRLGDPIAIEVKKDSDDKSPVVIALENELNEVTLKKTDLVTGKPVTGAVIQIFDETGVLICEETTNEDGRTEMKGLRAGTYTFREILAPEGYILNEETFTFAIDPYGEVDGVTQFTNDPTSLTIVKEDKENGRRLEGATFELYRLRDGEEPELMRFQAVGGLYIANATGDLTEVVSGDDGSIAILQLPCGDYRLIETEAPKGYDRNEQGVDVTLTDDGETLTVTLLNNATQPPAKTGEVFPIHAFPFLGLAIAFMAGVLILRKKRNSA